VLTKIYTDKKVLKNQLVMTYLLRNKDL